MLMPDTGYTLAHGQTRFYRTPAATDIEPMFEIPEILFADREPAAT